MPQATEQAFPAAAWLQSCEGRDGWDDAGPPFHVFGNTWYVGTWGISAILLTGTDGHVLIDGGSPAGGPLIAANIERLGFDLADVKVLLSSHEHFDHVGGLAYLRRATGADLVASFAAAPVLASGIADEDDPQSGILEHFAPVDVSRTVSDGEIVRLGDIAITAVATPGHTAGATSWTWQACEDARCRRIAYLDSLSAVSAEGYRFADHSEIVARFRGSFDKVATLPCDIVLTPHPASSEMPVRMANGGLASGMDCARYARQMAERVDTRLASEEER